MLAKKPHARTHAHINTEYDFLDFLQKLTVNVLLYGNSQT